jgi:Polysaccharide deacetylase
MIPIALAFHAEKLHDDRTWRRVERVARWMARKGIEATFFVYPFRAQVVRRDVTDRVRMLATLGHEIGQHTHFYAGRKIDKPEKVDDLSQVNIVHCLYRDFETLQQTGFPPKGFTAGAWFVNDTVLDTLAKLGFAYDCSAQFPKPKEVAYSPYHRWLQSPQLYTNAQGQQLLCLPTTCSLGEWFKWGRKLRTEGCVAYQLICLHDYDLLSYRNYRLLWCFLKLSERHALKPSAIIAEQYLFAGGDGGVSRSCEKV